MFPKLPLTNEGLLEFEEFNRNFSMVWNELITKWNEKPEGKQRKLFKDEIQGNQYEYYNILFKPNEKGKETIKNVWESFLNWWMSPYSGFHILDRISGDCIPIIYKNIEGYFNPDSVPDGNYVIQVVYDQLPNNLAINGSYFLIVSMHEIDTKYLSEENCLSSIDNISKRLYNIM